MFETAQSNVTPPTTSGMSRQVAAAALVALHGHDKGDCEDKSPNPIRRLLRQSLLPFIPIPG